MLIKFNWENIKGYFLENQLDNKIRHNL